MVAEMYYLKKSIYENTDFGIINSQQHMSRHSRLIFSITIIDLCSDLDCSCT